MSMNPRSQPSPFSFIAPASSQSKQAGGSVSIKESIKLNRKAASPIIPSQTFTSYLSAWAYKNSTGCKRKIKNLGFNKFEV